MERRGARCVSVTVNKFSRLVLTEPKRKFRRGNGCLILSYRAQIVFILSMWNFSFLDLTQDSSSYWCFVSAARKLQTYNGVPSCGSGTSQPSHEFHTMPLLPARKRRRISLDDESDHKTQLKEDDASDLLLTAKSLQWNLEQNYERKPRHKQKQTDSLRLPIKTSDGRLEQMPIQSAHNHPSRLAKGAADGLVGGAVSETPLRSSSEPVPEEMSIPPAQQLAEAKEELAKLAMLLNENPEDNIALLRKVGEITSSSNIAVRRLGLATQMAVFKDLIPGYRIRPLSEDDMKEKLSKEVRKLRSFEQSIVSNYHTYVQMLSQIANPGANAPAEHDEKEVAVAVACAAGMLNAAPHFNFRESLVQILVARLSSRVHDQSFGISCAAVIELFQSDTEGNASLETVTLLAKMIKAKGYRVDERVLNLFLHLRLLTELNMKGSTRSVEKTEDSSGPAVGTNKKSRQFRTKNERKLEKERQKIAKEMNEADATVSHEQRDQMQAETLKIVFGVYLHILKARSPRTTGAVLEGLVRYAHLINQDFFGDLLETLKDLIAENAGENSEEDAAISQLDDDKDEELYHNNLLCITTAFSLLKGQEMATVAKTLSLDLTYFVSHLYQALLPLAVSTHLESDPSTQRLRMLGRPETVETTSEKARINFHTTTVLLLRSLQSVMLPANSRDVSPERLAAFIKQVLTSSVHMPEKSCLALCSLLDKVAKIQHKKVLALWCTDERRGNGVFDPLRNEVESTNPFAATVWEGELLRLHYAPSVRQSNQRIAGTIQGELQ